MKQGLLLVDGYNMIAFWQTTRQLFKQNRLEEARQVLLRHLDHYAHFEGLEVICVFDAHYVPGVRQRYDQYRISVIFTEEDETADDYIERRAADLNGDPRYLVSVATSDLNEQLAVFSQGALRVSARELEQRVTGTKKSLDKLIDKRNLYTPRLSRLSTESLQALQDLLSELK